ncbi:MAG: hypothetical protein K2Z81_19475, partial [Cyanobacteria bacterium]|nr:hypothetical protein [Cyanobacteriota bacterium]
VKSSEQSRKDHLDARFSRDLTDADNTQITTNFGKDLYSRDREQLRNVLSTLLSGKVSKFEEFVPLGEKQMSQNVQRAFTAAMKSVGVVAEFSKNGYECLAGDFAPDSNRVIETGQSGEIRLKQQGKNSGVTSFECNVDDKPRPLTLGPRSSVRRYYDTHNWTSGPGKPPLSNIIDTIRSHQER